MNWRGVDPENNRQQPPQALAGEKNGALDPACVVGYVKQSRKKRQEKQNERNLWSPRDV